MPTYTEYVEAEKAAGREPKPMNLWRGENMKRAREAKASTIPPAEQLVEPVYDPDAASLASAPQVETTHPDRDPTVPAVETPNTVPTTDDVPETLIFQCDNRFRVEVMQAGRKVLVGADAVILPHRTIEFSERHWTADMRNRDHREKAEWLMTESEAFRKGEIVLVPQVIHEQSGVVVRTGPRTTNVPRVEGVSRPAGELSARLPG